MRDKDVIQHIQDLCKERSWTYYRLAKEADIPYSTLNNMVNRTNIPTIPTLQKLCDAFGITLADFFLDEPDALQLTEGQQEIITLYNNLSLEKKKILKAYMKGLLMDFSDIISITDKESSVFCFSETEAELFFCR